MTEDYRKPLAVSVADAAEMTGMGRTLLYNFMDAGELPYAKLGSRRVLLIADLEAFLQKKRQWGKSE